MVLELRVCTMRSLQLHGLYRDMLLYGSNGESNGQEGGIMEGLRGSIGFPNLALQFFGVGCYSKDCRFFGLYFLLLEPYLRLGPFNGEF